MKSVKRKKNKIIYIILITILTCILVVITAFLVFVYATTSNYKSFDDDFIIGNTLENIVDRYGEPYHPNPIDTSKEYYFICYLDEITGNRYYNIVFDKNIAVRVEKTIDAPLFG